MRVSSIMPSVQPKFVKNETTTESMSIPISGKNNIDLFPMNGAQNVVFNRKLAASQGISYITFTGNTDRNVNQVLSLAYENKGTGLPEDFQGGIVILTAPGIHEMDSPAFKQHVHLFYFLHVLL